MSFFNKPSAGDFLDASDVIDHLLYIPKVIKHATMPDKFNGGDKDTYRVIVVDLDGDETPREVILTAKWLVADLEEGMTNFLGRVVAKDTGRPKPAYVWDQPDEEDEARAIAWIEARKGSAFSKPQAEPAAPAAKVKPKPRAKPKPKPAEPVVEVDEGDDLADTMAALLAELS